MEEIKSKPQPMSSLLDGLDWTIPISRLLQISSEPDSRANYPISHLPISSRARVAFMILGVETVSQLLNLTIEEMMAVRRFGLRSVHHTIQVLEHFLQTTLVRDNSNQRERYDAPSYNKRSLSSATLGTESFGLVNDLDWDAPLRTILPNRSDQYASCNDPIAVLGLSVRSQNGLNNLEIATIDELLSSNVRRLMNIRHMGLRSVWNILQCLNHFNRTGYQLDSIGSSILLPAPSHDTDSIYHENVIPTSLRLDTENNYNNDITLYLDKDTRTLIYDLIVAQLTPKHLNTLQILGVYDIERLLCLKLIDANSDSDTTSILSLIERLTIFKQILWKIANERDCSNDRKTVINRFFQLYEKDEPTDILLNPILSGKVGLRLCVVLSAKPVHLNAAQLWFNTDHKKNTLQDIGDAVSVTRERARQIIIKAEGRLILHPGFVEWAVKEVYDIAVSYGGIISAVELEAELLLCNPSIGTPSRFRFVEFLSSLPKWDSSGLFLEDTTVQVSPLGDQTIKRIERVFISVAQRSSDDNPGPHLWSCSVAALMNDLAVGLNADNDLGSPCMRVSSEAVRISAMNLTELVRQEGNRIYSLPYWHLLYGTRVQQVEAVLFVSSSPMHHTEIANHLLRWSRKNQQKDISGTLERADKILLWGRGTYVHRSCVQLPYNLLREIATIIEEKLSYDIPFVSVAALFDQFENDCISSGLPTRQALYSALRITFSSKFDISEYPYIEPKGKAHTRLPLSIVIEEYVRSHGGLIEREEVINYLSNDLGVDKRLIPLHLSFAQNILFAIRHFIHVDNLKIDRQALYHLIDAAKQYLTNCKQLSVNELVNKRKILCMQVGIDDNRLLFSIIVHYADDVLSGSYPHLTNADKLDTLKSIAQIAADNIESYAGPCSMTDVKRYLVDEKGFREGTVNGILFHPQIVRYSVGSVIHLNVICWNEAKQTLLNAVAQEEYTRSLNKQDIVATVTKLFDRREDDLPDIGEVVWTETLVKSLLKRSNQWIFIGNANNAYVQCNSDIRSLDDYLSTYLTVYHSGACNLSELEEELRDNRVIVKHLTQEMLGNSASIIIDGHDVYLRRLVHAR